MKTITLVKFENGQYWNIIKADDIVESLDEQGLKVVSLDVVKKYNIKAGERKIDLLEKFGDDFEDDLHDCDFVDTYVSDYIKLDEIEENLLYFDDYADEFFSGTDILSWDTEEYYWYFNGSNFVMREIIEKKEIEAEYIDSEPYETGNILLYRLKNQKEFKVDSSFYQGTIDNVFKEDGDIIDDE